MALERDGSMLIGAMAWSTTYWGMGSELACRTYGGFWEERVTSIPALRDSIKVTC
jgi:hypothetical protein